jgi:hypothetical protein
MKTELIKSLIDLALNQPQESHVKSQPSGQHIVVLDRGFVYVGYITVDDEWIRISNAKNIRVWGTKNGLGELRNGPLQETKLDLCDVVLAPRRALISLIPCKGF